MKTLFRFIPRKNLISKPISRFFSSAPDYIHEDSKAEYEETMRLFNAARELMQKNCQAEAMEKIKGALSLSTMIEGEAPALSGLRIKFLRLKQEIEVAQKNPAPKTIVR